MPAEFRPPPAALADLDYRLGRGGGGDPGRRHRRRRVRGRRPGAAGGPGAAGQFGKAYSSFHAQFAKQSAALDNHLQ
jgi:hypothetical protein